LLGAGTAAVAPGAGVAAGSLASVASGAGAGSAAGAGSVAGAVLSVEDEAQLHTQSNATNVIKKGIFLLMGGRV